LCNTAGAIRAPCLKGEIMAHAIWKGSISFGLVQIPVGLYPGEKRDDFNFTMLDKNGFSPVGYKRYNKNTGQEVGWNDVVKGYEYEEGQYVVLSEDDLKNANPKATQTVEILDFVDADDITAEYFDKPYFLAPTKKGVKGYALLRETLKKTGKAGIAKVVIHTREYIAALIPRGDALVLDILRYPYEIRDTSDLEIPGEKISELGVTDKEIKMAEMLVKGMEDKWDPSRYKDTYREDVMKMIDEKVKTGDTKHLAEAVLKEEKKGAEIIDLMSLLKKSVEEKEAQWKKTPAKSEKKPAPAKGGKKAA
jgi:DNA end-binding protein Ku